MSNVIQKIKAFLINNRKTILESVVFCAFVIALVFLFVLSVNINIVVNTSDSIYDISELDQIDNDYDCILILGAGVRKDGTATPMLNDRLMSGISAFESNKSHIVFVTGDSEYASYTETVTMKNVLVSNGIGENAIISDGYGLSTYESIWRAKNVYGFKKILIISQKYHLHRAVYIAEKLGLYADGLDAALQKYSKQPIYSLREYLARIKDLIYTEMQPYPQYLEKWEGFYE